jgi:hypothetical protein
MTTSPFLTSRLKETLGNEAGEELVRIVDRASNDISDLRGDVAELRHQMELGFARVDARFAGVDSRFAQVEKQIERQTNRLILWSFAFWATTMAGLATLLVTLAER